MRYTLNSEPRSVQRSFRPWCRVPLLNLKYNRRERSRSHFSEISWLGRVDWDCHVHSDLLFLSANLLRKSFVESIHLPLGIETVLSTGYGI